MISFNSDITAEVFFQKTFSECLSKISDVSKSDDGKFFVKSDMPAWNFDQITKKLFPKREPGSVDSILFSGKNIYFIEFKSGIEKLIDWKKFDPNKILCEVLADRPCPRLGIMRRQRDNYKEDMLLLNFQMKASDSYKTFEKMIVPKIIKQGATTYFKCHLHFIAVVDCQRKENEVTENILLQMSNAETFPEINHLAKIGDALKKFERNDLWYDRVVVYDVEGFLSFLDEKFS